MMAVICYVDGVGGDSGGEIGVTLKNFKIRVRGRGRG